MGEGSAYFFFLVRRESAAFFVRRAAVFVLEARVAAELFAAGLLLVRDRRVGF